MLTSVRSLLAASVLASAALAAPAYAQDEESTSEFSVSGNVALVTDYRFRGVSLSNGEPAIQGGIDIAHSSGFYVGTWASSIEDSPTYGEMELDLYAGWSGEVTPGLTLDVGLLYYAYPSKDETFPNPLFDPTDPTTGPALFQVGPSDYFEPYLSLSTEFGPLSATLGVAYAWDQSSLGGKDNLYVYTDLGADIPGTPFSVSGHLGYTDGVLAPPLLSGTNDDTGIDYSIGISATVLGGLSVGVSYIGTEGPNVNHFTDDAVVGTLSYEF